MDSTLVSLSKTPELLEINFLISIKAFIIFILALTAISFFKV